MRLTIDSIEPSLNPLPWFVTGKLGVTGKWSGW